MSYTSVVGADSPTSWWHLNETSGTAAADTAGTNPLTYTGTLTLGASSLVNDTGTAVTFTGGTSSWASAATLNGIANSASLSLEAWVKISANPSSLKYILSLGGNEMWIGIETTGKVSTLGFVTTTGNFKITSPSAISLNQPHHIVGVFNGTSPRLTLYIDGVSVVTSATNALNWTGFLSQISVACENGGTASFMLGGTVDEPAIYTTALSAAQVLSHYNAGLAQIQLQSLMMTGIGI